MFDVKCVTSSDEEEMDGAQISRCAKVSSADLDELENSRSGSSTVRQTIWAVNCFKAWLHEKNITLAFKTAEKSELTSVLREFYGSIRTSKGELYGINSYLGLRGGLNRFFNDPPLHRGWNLMQDAEFRSANNVFKGIVKQIRRSGRDLKTHYPPISCEDQHILKHSPALDPGNPKGLLSKVWFDIQLHFGLRGKEGNRQLQPDSFTLRRDQNGFKCFVLVSQNMFCESNNPIKRNRDRTGAAMYEEPGNPLCPVASLEKYLSKIPADAKALYLQPKRTFVLRDDVWYTALPLGVNYLSHMLPRICKEAGTLTIYSNRSLRLTAVQKQTESRANPMCVNSGHIEPNNPMLQESALNSASSETDCSSVTHESPMSSHDWLKQEPENEIIEWEKMTSGTPGDAEQDNTNNAISTTTPVESLPPSVMLTITKLQCIVESKQQKIEALEKQVLDLQEDRKFLRTQIENLTSARVVQIPEASTSVFLQSRSHKRQLKRISNPCDSDESFSDGSDTSLEELRNIKKKRHNKKKRKREQCGISKN